MDLNLKTDNTLLKVQTDSGINMNLSVPRPIEVKVGELPYRDIIKQMSGKNIAFKPFAEKVGNSIVFHDVTPRQLAQLTRIIGKKVPSLEPSELYFFIVTDPNDEERRNLKVGAYGIEFTEIAFSFANGDDGLVVSKIEVDLPGEEYGWEFVGVSYFGYDDIISGGDLSWRIADLRQAVESMANMREAYDNLSQAAEAYNTGKVQLAANITEKGVQASATETLPELAEKVLTITQQPIILSPSEVGDMYAKQQFGALTTPNYWNLYEVLNTLLNDGRLLNYGGILLAEYYRGYDSLALSGAGAGGAYVVSDMENGQFKMYTEDTTHTWATEFDGKGNRWVAYCFADEYHDFQITDTNTSPRSIFIGRKVGTITSLVNGRVSQIVCPDGNEYTKFNPGTYTQNWDKRVVLRGIKNQTGYLIYNAGSMESMYIEGDNITGRLFYQSLPNLASLVIKCNTINEIIFTPYGGTYIPLNYINIDNADGRLSLSEESFNFSNSKKDFIITNTESFELYSNQLTANANMSNSRVYFGYRTNDKTKTVKITNGNPTWNELPDVELKVGWCKPLDIRRCIGLTEANMYAHILQRLKQDEPDCGSGVTITLGSTNLNKLTSEESQELLATLRGTYGYTFA